MKTVKYLGLLLLLVVCVGCYKDKGHYDYTKVDLVSFEFTPGDYITMSDNTLKFIFKQPLTDTIRGEIYVAGVRSNNEEESINGEDLEYLWINLSGDKDSTYGRTLHYALPPKETTNQRYNLVIRDPKTTLEFYREIVVATQVPYLNSWFLLHGIEGDRKLGTIEMGEEKIFITQDAYFEVNGERRFQNATDMIYNPRVGPGRESERLEIFSPDSVFSVVPFRMKVDRTFDFIMPQFSPRLVLKKAVSAYTAQFCGIITEDAKLLHTGKEFLHFFAETDNADPRTANYSATDCHVDKDGTYTIWDAKQRCFHYYNSAMNQYYIGTDRADEDRINISRMTTIPDNAWQENELTERSVVRFSAVSGFSTVAIMKNDNSGELWAYNIGYGGKGKSRGVLKATKGDDPGASFEIQVERYPLTGVNIDKESPFATSDAFPNQFMYAEGNKLYRYNYLSGDRQEIYFTEDESDEITLIRFASPYEFILMNPDYTRQDHFNRLLGIAVRKSDNTHELHNILIARSGDVEKSSVYGSFEEIKQIIFTLQAVLY